MEPKFQTSFIPKNTMAPREDSFKRVKSFNLFSTIATLLFILTLGAWGGLYFYKNTLNNEIVKLKQDIADTREAFEPETINELISFSNSIKSTNQLLQNHISVSALFDSLQSLTVRPIQFVEFSYSEISGQVLVEIVMQGSSYAAFAQQSEIFKNQSFIINPEFSDFTVTESGAVEASFSAIIDKSMLSYEKNLVENIVSSSDTINNEVVNDEVVTEQ